jgi:RND family efflux transporter MFP subunit
MKSKKKIIIGIVVIVLIAAGIFAVKSAKSRESKTPVAKMYAIVVSAIKPELKNIQLTLPYIAEIQNDKDVKLTSKIAGRVNSILPSGTAIKRGDVIARLDNTEISGNTNSINAQIKAQEKILTNLKTTHARTLELLAVKGASIEQSQAEESKIAGTEAQIESLKQKKNELNNTQSYATITSPVDGIVSKTMVNKGDIAMPGHPVASLSAKNGYYLLIRVPSNLNISKVQMEGQQYDAIDLHNTYHGLKEYKSYVNNKKLTSGTREEVDVIIFDDNAILLPFDAILNRDGKSYVLVVEGEKATLKQIEIIQTGENGIAVKNKELVKSRIVIAKQDILLKLASGVSIIIKE